MEKHEQPAWVQYVLTADEVSRRAAKRGDDFRPDPEIPTGSATQQDYARSGYDRGHLASPPIWRSPSPCIPRPDLRKKDEKKAGRFAKNA